MIKRSDGVPTAGDRNQTIGGQRRRDAGQRHRRGVERRQLERAERAVPHQRPARFEDIARRLDRARAEIENHFVGRYLMDVDRPVPRPGRELGRDDDVVRQMDDTLRGFGAGENVERGRGHVVFAQRLADIDPARRQKRVGHRPADDQVIDLGDEMQQGIELRRHLGPADDGRDRVDGLTKCRIERVELRRHRASGEGGQDVRQSLGRRVGTVRGREGVVHVKVATGRKRRYKLRVVCLLAGVETRVLEYEHAAVGQRCHRSLRDRPDAIGGERDRAAEHTGERRCNRAQRQRRVDFDRPPEMRQDNDLRTGIGEQRQRRHRRRQPRHVADVIAVHRHVEVGADDDAPAPDGTNVVQRAEHQTRRAISVAVSTMRFEKPHSLSYQLTTRTRCPSSTVVSRLSIVDEAGSPL